MFHTNTTLTRTFPRSSIIDFLLVPNYPSTVVVRWFPDSSMQNILVNDSLSLSFVSLFTFTVVRLYVWVQNHCRRSRRLITLLPLARYSLLFHCNSEFYNNLQGLHTLRNFTLPKSLTDRDTRENSSPKCHHNQSKLNEYCLMTEQTVNMRLNNYSIEV